MSTYRFVPLSEVRRIEKERRACPPRVIEERTEIRDGREYVVKVYEPFHPGWTYANSRYRLWDVGKY